MPKGDSQGHRGRLLEHLTVVLDSCCLLVPNHENLKRQLSAAKVRNKQAHLPLGLQHSGKF